MWREGAHNLSRINEEVYNDIDDHIILQGFRAAKCSPGQIKNKITGFLETVRLRELMWARKNKQENDPLEEGKAQDVRRNFCNSPWEGLVPKSSQ